MSDATALDALRPSRLRPMCPENTPGDLPFAVSRARGGDAQSLALLQEWAKWRLELLTLEQLEAAKVETLFGFWRVFERALNGPIDGAEVVTKMRNTVVAALVKWWGVELESPHPLDFAAARKVAARVTRRLHDLPDAWRAL